MAKYEVICEGPQGQPTFWAGDYTDKGGQLLPKGAIVDLDPEKVKVSATSATLKPVGDSPVWKRNVATDGTVTHEQVRPKKAA